MKLTTQRLKKLIKEELQAALREGKDEALKMIMDLEKGDDLGMILADSDLKELVLNGDKEGALEEIRGMKYDTETAGEDELLQELERLIQKM